MTAEMMLSVLNVLSAVRDRRYRQPFRFDNMSHAQPLVCARPTKTDEFTLAWSRLAPV